MSFNKVCWVLIVVAACASAAYLVMWPGETMLASGRLWPVEAAECSGRAELVLRGEKRLLRLSDVAGCGDRPVEVLVLASTNARDSETVQSTQRVVAGALARPAGTTLEWPVGADPGRFRAVTLWEPGRRVNLATAGLRP